MNYIFQVIRRMIEFAIFSLASSFLHVIITCNHSVAKTLKYSLNHENNNIYLSNISMPGGGWARQHMSLLGQERVSRHVEHTSSWSHVLSFLSRTELTRLVMLPAPGVSGWILSVADFIIDTDIETSSASLINSYLLDNNSYELIIMSSDKNIIALSVLHQVNFL